MKCFQCGAAFSELRPADELSDENAAWHDETADCVVELRDRISAIEEADDGPTWIPFVLTAVGIGLVVASVLFVDLFTRVGVLEASK